MRNCSWSSCREGCTQEIFECHQVHVEYRIPGNTKTQRAGLFVNIAGCGYPPDVDCEEWINMFGVNDSTIQCYYSRTNTSMAVTHSNPGEDKRNLLLATLVPVLCCLLSGSALCVFHTKCVQALASQKQR